MSVTLEFDTLVGSVVADQRQFHNDETQEVQNDTPRRKRRKVDREKSSTVG